MSRSLCFAVALLLSSVAAAQVAPGTSFDFESETTEGWGGGSSPVNVASGGPAGADDAFLQVGNGNNWAVFNTDLSGVLDPTATRIQVDLNRPAGESDMEIRLVLFGPNSGLSADRWTSTDSVLVPGNGEWATYEFSLLEADLTQVRGVQTYDALAADLDRIMFRYDPDAPSPGGQAIPGTLGLDNILVLADAPDLPGDINGDGSVDLLDLDILGSNFGLTPATPEQGDLNDDNVVDLLDLDILGSNFGATAGAESLPEPTAGLLAMIAVAGTALRRRR